MLKFDTDEYKDRYYNVADFYKQQQMERILRAKLRMKMIELGIYNGSKLQFLNNCGTRAFSYQGFPVHVSLGDPVDIRKKAKSTGDVEPKPSPFVEEKVEKEEKNSDKEEEEEDDEEDDMVMLLPDQPESDDEAESEEDLEDMFAKKRHQRRNRTHHQEDAAFAQLPGESDNKYMARMQQMQKKPRKRK